MGRGARVPVPRGLIGRINDFDAAVMFRCVTADLIPRPVFQRAHVAADREVHGADPAEQSAGGGCSRSGLRLCANAAGETEP